MLKLTALSMSVMVTLSEAVVIDAVPSSMVALLSVATMVSPPSTTSSLTASTAKTSVGRRVGS